MSLITSVMEAESLKRPETGTAGGIKSVDGGFKNQLKSGLAGGVTEDMDAIFSEAETKYGLPSGLVRAVAKAESNFNPGAVSRSGAVGVMQLMPGTAKLLGVTDSYDARQNIMGGAKYLKENLDRFGDVRLALAAYNAGPGSVKRYGGVPPYQETQNYVDKVMSYLGGSPIYANKSVTTGGIRSGTDQLFKTNGSPVLSVLSGLPGNSGLSGLSGAAGRYGGLGMSALPGITASEDGDTITMDKESFSSLIQILRIQMMMSADREVGTIFT